MKKGFECMGCGGPTDPYGRCIGCGAPVLSPCTCAKQPIEELLYKRIIAVLEANDGLAMDNPRERRKLALALQYALTEEVVK